VSSYALNRGSTAPKTVGRIKAGQVGGSRHDCSKGELTHVEIHRRLGRLEIGDLLMKQPLGRPNLADSFKQFFKIVLAKQLAALLKAFVVQDKSFD
jgi:hypothetical protein